MSEYAVRIANNSSVHVIQLDVAEETFESDKKFPADFILTKRPGRLRHYHVDNCQIERF